MKSVADPPSESGGATKSSTFVEGVDKENRVKLLIDKIQHPYLHGATTSHGCSTIRIDAKLELKTYIEFGHIIQYEREYHTYACTHCGQGFQEVDYFRMKSHADETGCKNGFCNRKCFCKKQFETIDDAFKHYLKMDCLQYHKERQEAIKRQEQKKIEYKEKKKEHNDNRKPTSRCEICDVEFRCKYEEERHMNGKQHQYKASPMSLTCACCNISVLSRKQMETHLQTKKHQKRMNSSETIQVVNIPVLEQ